eukprot:Rmarinus@m.9684
MLSEGEFIIAMIKHLPAPCTEALCVGSLWWLTVMGSKSIKKLLRDHFCGVPVTWTKPPSLGDLQRSERERKQETIIYINGLSSLRGKSACLSLPECLPV